MKATSFFATVLLLAVLGFQCGANAQGDLLEGKLKTYLENLEDRGFKGAICIAYRGKIVVSKGYGMADEEHAIKNTAETAFDIGSVTKQFTAAAILKLQMMGKLSVHDKLSKYFLNVPDSKKDIAVHHLLTHSAGLPAALGGDYTAISNEDFLNLVWTSPAVKPVGEEYEYSNVGYSLLALIIEKVSGTNYEDFLHKYLFVPSGMRRTGYRIPSWAPTEVAVGYKAEERWGKPNEKPWGPDGPYLHLKGNGGIISTVGDLYKWHLALLDETVLDNQSKKTYYTPHIKENPEGSSFYGYGWAIIPTPRDTILVAHNGGNEIFFADFWRYLTEEITIVILTNQASRQSELLASDIARILLKSA